MRFALENRYKYKHNCQVEFAGLVAGNYQVEVDGKPLTIRLFGIERNQLLVIDIPVSRDEHHIELIRID